MAVNLDGMKRNRRARYDVLSEDNLKGIYSRMTEMLGSPEVRGTLKSDESQALQDAMLLVVRGAYAKITKTFPSQNGRRPFPVGPRRFTKQSLTDSENEILAEAFDIASRFRIPIPVPVSDRTQFRPYAPLSAVDAG